MGLPVNPVQNPTIPANSAGAQIAESGRQNKEKFDEFQIYQQTDRALKTIQIAAVEKYYIYYLRDKYIGYANVTTLQMLTPPARYLCVHHTGRFGGE